MIKINNPADCCGCTACASICAHDAITMKPDALGFLYPEVDKDKCVDCGLCEKVCAFNDHYDTSMNLEKPLAYGARHKDMNEVEAVLHSLLFPIIYWSKEAWSMEQATPIISVWFISVPRPKRSAMSLRAASMCKVI